MVMTLKTYIDTNTGTLVTYKGRSLSYDMGLCYAPYIPLMNITITWEAGHPGGWTDDLGIIADKNQYVEERLPGWYAKVPRYMHSEIVAWCEKNLQGGWYWDSNAPTDIHMISERDASWFALKWL